ncbi:MAG: hypothetical protein ACRCXX_13950 [Cetobacterium sp.]|uniref:hypothetical protein n=1 Tax=Cetobacterium sp. TaxID=2071632 RepID=UPI003F2EBE46
MKKFNINNASIKLTGRKFLLETIISIPESKVEKQSIYEAVLTVDKLGDNIYGYALDGYNHVSNNEFSFADVCTLDELKVKFAKFKITFKEEK